MKPEFTSPVGPRLGASSIQLTAICTVEGKSGYVLGHHLNYDPDVNQVDVEDTALRNGDLDPSRRSYFREQPQYWLNAEFDRMAGLMPTEIRPDFGAEAMTVDELIAHKRKWGRLAARPGATGHPGTR